MTEDEVGERRCRQDGPTALVVAWAAVARAVLLVQLRLVRSMLLLRRILLLVIVTAVLLEAVLQAVAFTMFVASRPPTAEVADSGATRILCVGDSFTYGDGASDPAHSYPASMERILAERHGIDAQVVNAGWPGQDSRDVLATLRDRMDTVRPNVVCVIVGANDKWNRPEPLAADQAVEKFRFRFRWRTARLLRLLFGGWGVLHDHRQPQTPPPAQTPPADTAPQPPPPPTQAMVAAARVLVRDAGVTWNGESPVWPEKSAPAAQEAIDDAKRRLAANDLATARKVVVDALASHPHDSFLHLVHIEVALRIGDTAAAEQGLAALQAGVAAKPDVTNAHAYVLALTLIGRLEEAHVAAKVAVTVMPRALNLWQDFAAIELRRDEAAAGRCYRKCLELTENIRPWDDTNVAGLGRCLAKTDPRAAARLLLAGLLLQGRIEGWPWSCCLVVAPTRVQREHMQDLLAPDGIDARGATLLRTAFDELYVSNGDSWRRVLRGHLLAIGTMAYASGAKLVFATYPSEAEQNAILKEAANECGAAFVPLRDRFERELRTRRRGDLFVADGHCNDAGYEIMAVEIAKTIADLK